MHSIVIKTRTIFFLVKLLRSWGCFLKNLHEWQEFYTTAGRTGRAKYQLWGGGHHSGAICTYSAVPCPFVLMFNTEVLVGATTMDHSMVPSVLIPLLLITQTSRCGATIVLSALTPFLGWGPLWLHLYLQAIIAWYIYAKVCLDGQAASSHIWAHWYIQHTACVLPEQAIQNQPG